MNIPRLVAAAVFIGLAIWVNRQYWSRALNRPRGTPMDGWTIYAEMRRDNPKLARRWACAQVVMMVAGLYAFFPRR